MTSPGADFAFVHDGEVLTRFTLEPGAYIIGRRPECEISIDLDGIGLTHAQLVIGERLFLQNLSVAFGTFIAGRRLNSPQELDSGVEIQLGRAGILRVENWRRSPSVETPEPTQEAQNAPAPSERVETAQIVQPETPEARDPDQGTEVDRPESAVTKPVLSEPRFAERMAAGPDAAPAGSQQRDTSHSPHLAFVQAAASKKVQAPTPSAHPKNTRKQRKKKRGRKDRPLTQPPPHQVGESASGVASGNTFKSEERQLAPGDLPRVPASAEPEVRNSFAVQAPEEPPLTLDAPVLPAAELPPTSARSDGTSLPNLPAHPGNGAPEPEKPAVARQSHPVSTPAEPPLSIKLIDAEIKRLRLALVEEMERRRRAEKWVNATADVPLPVVEESAPDFRASRWTLQKKLSAAATLVMAVAIVCFETANWARKRLEEVRAATLTVAALRPAAQQFAEMAEKRIDEQDWLGARQQLQYALTLAPECAAWRSRLADIFLAEFKLDRALAAYRQSAADDARLTDAWDGITVCERLVRAREVSGSPSESALYTVHRTLMRHGRLAEAVRVAARLPADADLQQRTWQERLQKGGLDADVQLNEARELTVRLRGAVQSKLPLLRGIPAVAIWMPETDARDLTPLAGLALEELDLSRTMVAKLDALRNMPLRLLSLDRTQVEDLLPLRGSPLEELHLSHTPVSSISSLRTMPLRKLDIGHTKVANLQPLATVPLRELDASGTPVADLSALEHLPLTTVRLDDTRVVDLTPLHGAPINTLSLARTPVTSLEALTQTPITVLSLSGCTQIRDLTPLTKLRDLQKFILPSRTTPQEVQNILPQIRFLE